MPIYLTQFIHTTIKYEKIPDLFTKNKKIFYTYLALGINGIYDIKNMLHFIYVIKEKINE